MNVRLSIDRFEGDKKGIAVLLTEDGRSINFPRDLLPKGTKAGEVIALTLERDQNATRGIQQRTRAVRDDLSKGDPGGDIKL